MKKKLLHIFLLNLILTSFIYSQPIVNKTLLKADKLFIKQKYENAVVFYVNYLSTNPKEYYASRQAAVCYNKLNKPEDAIDYWPEVVQSSEATETDNLEYAKCLLLNNRGDEAKKIFQYLSKSYDKNIADLAKSYLNP